jgi:molybdenum cofactor synthesis domain-containing protein
MKTAQILIIGNEILSGRTQDTNSHYLARALFARGVRVVRTEVIPDEINQIAGWVNHNHGLSDYVFICGGIGGTPDDLTRQAVARGMGVAVERHPRAEALLRAYYKERINSERLNMADLPSGCELIENSMTLAPGFKIGNIYVFAGIPEIMKAMWEVVAPTIAGTPLFEKELNLKVGEGDIALHMKTVMSAFPQVEIGSYPSLRPDERGYRTQIVIRSHSEDLNEAALQRFKQECGEKT